MIQAEANITLADDAGGVASLGVSVVADDDPDTNEVAAAVTTAEQLLLRTIAAATAVDPRVPDHVPDGLGTPPTG